MFFSGVHRKSISGAAIFLCSRFVVAGGTCAFRFAGYPNLTELPTWTLPAAEPLGVEVSTYSSGNGLVYLANDDTEEPVDCVGDSWRYQLANGEWRTDVNFPDADSTSATFDGILFNATADGIFTVSGIAASIAPAVSDSLYGRTIQLDLACNQEDAVDDADACVLFQVNFTNYSPEVDANMALYRFEDPAVPGFELPLAQPFSPGDVRLNEGNPIVELDGSVVDNACNGDVAEYLGENGEWYFWITGTDGQMFNLTHVFYATATDAVNIATIQEIWSPNLEAALYNRVVRLLIHCNNAVAFEEGYLLFYVGDAEFAQSCTEFPELCASYGVDSSGGVSVVGHGGGAAAGLAAALGRLLVAVGAVSASAVYRRWW